MGRHRRRLRDRGLLGRLAAYRRWGSRKNWTGNNAHDITVTDRGAAWPNPSGRFWAEGWSTCRCGKVRHIWAAEHSEKMARLTLKMKGSLCKPCAAWTFKRTNTCPDGNCTLGYEHTGRCRPFVIPTDLQRAALAERGV